MTLQAMPAPAAFAAEYISSCDAIAMIAGWHYGEDMGQPRAIFIDPATGMLSVRKLKRASQAHRQNIGDVLSALKFPRYAAYVEIRDGDTRAVYRPLPRAYWYRPDADQVIATGRLREPWEGIAAGAPIFLRLADIEAHHAKPRTAIADISDQKPHKKGMAKPEKARDRDVFAWHAARVVNWPATEPAPTIGDDLRAAREDFSPKSVVRQQIRDARGKLPATHAWRRPGPRQGADAE